MILSVSLWQCLESGSGTVGSGTVGSGSKGQNINQKLQKKNLISKPKSDLLKKEKLQKLPNFWTVQQVLA